MTKCNHVWPSNGTYGITQSWPTDLTLNRVMVFICNNCPTVKVIHQYDSGDRETIVEPPIDNPLINLYNKTIEIFESALPWEVKYDEVFSDNISHQVFKLVDLDYYDPDSSYQEDVTAFVEAFKDKMFQLQLNR